MGSWVGLGLLVPYLVAGWRGLVWAGLVRMVVVNHLTFSVNSICHTFGRRSFETKDGSRNNWLVAFLAMARAGTTTTTRSPAPPTTG